MALGEDQGIGRVNVFQEITLDTKEAPHESSGLHGAHGLRQILLSVLFFSVGSATGRRLLLVECVGLVFRLLVLILLELSFVIE